MDYSQVVAFEQRYSSLDAEIEALTQQLEEINNYRENSKGKCRADDLPDNEIVVSAFLDEVTMSLGAFGDMKLARSIADAVDSDAQAITTIAQEEIQVQDDRRLSIQTSLDDPQLEDPPTVDNGPNCDDAISQEMKFRSLFLWATTDESLFPPKCCGELIPLAFVQDELSEHELDQFKSAGVEFSTMDRTYCSNTGCGRFISLPNITADRATCFHCGSYTCLMCKNAYHDNDDCPADSALEATLTLATSQGWQRCFACRALVELNTGCYHMTCKCKAAFCYLCGNRWKSCMCPQWEERRLYERVEEVVDREAVNPLQRQARVAEIENDLRHNHDNCVHSRHFQRITGGHRRPLICEICGAHHRGYLLQCRRCYVMVCQKCRRNRV
ncbi:hypothetical protein BDW59DRAFT_168514 [Aspergillus cavernicola]|uniref:RBR-type E3 ubiquitin transferase n=1 Tax=Aspergillus cavernicola TaxID=176166 RepID=A0ABR4J5G8_9EURO